MVVLAAALGAHRQGQPVRLDLQGGCLSALEHTQAWALLLELLDGEPGAPDVKVVDGELKLVPSVSIRGPCWLQRLRISAYELPELQGTCNMICADGGLTMQDCELSLHAFPASWKISRDTNRDTCSSRSGSAGSQSSEAAGDSGGAPSCASSPRTKLRASQPCHCALFAAGSIARLHVSGCRFSGFQHTLLLLHGAQAEVEGCEASHSVLLTGVGLDPCILVRTTRCCILDACLCSTALV